MTNIEALKRLIAALGGDPDSLNISLNADAISATAKLVEDSAVSPGNIVPSVKSGECAANITWEKFLIGIDNGIIHNITTSDGKCLGVITGIARSALLYQVYAIGTDEGLPTIFTISDDDGVPEITVRTKISTSTK